MKPFFVISLALFLSACGPALETVQPGRGAEREVGPLARVYPAGEDSRMDRHGLWRGFNGDQMVWEVRYTRGLPTGPYRSWNENGELTATWPYNWDGEIDGWARWFENGNPGFKRKLSSASAPAGDWIGRQADLKTLLEQSEPPQD